LTDRRETACKLILLAAHRLRLLYATSGGAQQVSELQRIALIFSQESFDRKRPGHFYFMIFISEDAFYVKKHSTDCYTKYGKPME
jgi:hypothetical protein